MKGALFIFSSYTACVSCRRLGSCQEIRWAGKLRGHMCDLGWLFTCWPNKCARLGFLFPPLLYADMSFGHSVWAEMTPVLRQKRRGVLVRKHRANPSWMWSESFFLTGCDWGAARVTSEAWSSLRVVLVGLFIIVFSGGFMSLRQHGHLLLGFFFFAYGCRTGFRSSVGTDRSDFLLKNRQQNKQIIRKKEEEKKNLCA